MAHDVFISHSSKDKTAADAICHALESSGVKCWIAPRDVRAGEEYAGELTIAIKNCRIFLLIFSKESNVSKPVSKEIETAFRYEKTVIPFRIEDVEMRDALEYYLSNLHWLEAYPDDKEFDSLVKAVKNALGITDQAPVAVPAPTPVPKHEYCENCGTAYNPDNVTFCLECGAKLTEDAHPPIPIVEYCENCGTPHNPAKDVFCLECGAKL
ncbi:MAG: TIR domain-containing protein [Oscillospiraceae bacterium]|nr:TIR domain-containing protein [Oscillospiraceae bacterium]